MLLYLQQARVKAEYRIRLRSAYRNSYLLKTSFMTIKLDALLLIIFYF
jgi:hypothetical protein